jgi:hypothetical protein
VSNIGEAWGFKLSDDVEYRRKPTEPGARGKIVRFAVDKTIWVKNVATAKSHSIANPRNVRLWKPPTTLAEIEQLLEEEQ